MLKSLRPCIKERYNIELPYRGESQQSKNVNNHDHKPSLIFIECAQSTTQEFSTILLTPLLSLESYDFVPLGHPLLKKSTGSGKNYD